MMHPMPMGTYLDRPDGYAEYAVCCVCDHAMHWQTWACFKGIPDISTGRSKLPYDELLVHFKSHPVDPNGRCPGFKPIPQYTFAYPPMTLCPECKRAT